MSEHEDGDVERSSIVGSEGARSRGDERTVPTAQLEAAHCCPPEADRGRLTTGAADQLGQVIEGKLETEGYEAQNV